MKDERKRTPNSSFPLHPSSFVWRLIWQLAGVIGLDPAPFTLRELVWMADAQQDLSGMDDLLSQTSQDKVSVKGTFNALGARGLGSEGPAERTAKATEVTAKNTKRILQEAQHGGLTFGEKKFTTEARRKKREEQTGMSVPLFEFRVSRCARRTL